MNENEQFQFLYHYYNEEDIASIYGIERLEIKHSNFLKWLFQPKDDTYVEKFPIYRLLKLIQKCIKDTSNPNEYYAFSLVNLDNVEIKNVEVKREFHHIDLVITCTIEQHQYVIAIENKIEALEREKQLEDYKKNIQENYKEEKLFVLLHPNYSQLQLIDAKASLEKSANNNNYISITYQDLYDFIFKDYVELLEEPRRYIVCSYIHTLSCYFSNKLYGLIITEKEKDCIEYLFQKKEFLSILEGKLFRQDKTYEHTYNIICEKYKCLKHFDEFDLTIQMINNAFKNRTYIFYIDGVPQYYSSIAKMVYGVLTYLIQHENIKTVEDFGENLKNRLICKDWFLHEYYENIDNVWGGIFPDSIIIGKQFYYCTKYVSYEAFLQLKKLIIERFPKYRDCLEIV